MNEKRDNPEMLFDGLIRRSLVPKGFRPDSDEEIEAMLDGLGVDEVAHDKLQRMLEKILGTSPMGWAAGTDRKPDWHTDTFEAKEFAEMHRSRGEDLPPELEELIRKMEVRASEIPKEEDGADAD